MTALDRDQLPITRSRWRWFDHAGVSPLPAEAADTIARWAAAAAVNPRTPVEPSAAEVRQAAGALLGVSAADIAFTRSTTDGIGLVTAGFGWTDRDRVVVPDCEFPSNLFPWLALRDRGVRVDTVPLPSLTDAVLSGDAPTVVAASWVQFARGERIDLAALAEAAHRRGALLVADVIQGAGVLPCSLAEWGVDVAVAGGHKWLLGPEGVGLAYVSARAREHVHPVAPGWASVTRHDDYADYTLELLPDARRYEGGTDATGLIAGFGRSLELLRAAGVAVVWQHVDSLCEQLIAGLPASATVLSDRSNEGRSGIVTFTLDGLDPHSAVEHLAESGLVLKSRGGGIRFAPHGYTAPDDVDALLAAVRAL